MGLFQDNFSSLSELERLAAMAHDPVRVQEIGTDQWPLAMMACGLIYCNDPEAFEENYGIYAIFAQKSSPAARLDSLSKLLRFILSRKGEGWQALLPYALCEPLAPLARQAALQVASLAKPEGDNKLHGVSCLVAALAARRDLAAPAAVLSALCELADMRLLPLLEPLCELPEETLGAWLQGISAPLNRMNADFLLRLLARHSALTEKVLAALCLMAPKAPVVMDVAMPIPTWAYSKATPQPLHGWSTAEYFPRLLPQLEGACSAAQLEQVRQAFGA